MAAGSRLQVRGCRFKSRIFSSFTYFSNMLCAVKLRVLGLLAYRLCLPPDTPIISWLNQCFIQKGYHTICTSSRFWAGLWTDLTIEQALMKSVKNRGGLTHGRGLTESVRLQWVLSMHQCAAVHRSMTTLTGLNNVTSYQHIDLGAKRHKHDFRDLNSIQ